MRQKTVPEQNVRLVRPLLLAAALAGAVPVFALLMPNEDRLLGMARKHAFDPMSTAYLSLLVKARPADAALRSALAANYIRAGKLDEAMETLRPIAEAPGMDGRQARMEILDMEIGRLNRPNNTNADSKAMHASITAKVEQLIHESGDRPTLVKLVDLTARLGLPRQMADAYRQLALVDPLSRLTWLNALGLQCLAIGEPREAAGAFEEASRIGGHWNSKREHALAAADAYLAADAGGDAMAWLKAQLGDYADDAGYVQKLMGLALAQQDSTLAQQLGRYLAELLPKDAGVASLQIDAALAASDLGSALQAASRLARLEPGEASHRERLARIAEWAGQPGVALEEWAGLARSGVSSAAMQQAMRLARDLQQDGLWLELTSRVIALRRLSAEETATLAAIATRRRSDALLEQFLVAALARYPGDSQLRQALAAHQEQLGKLDDALRTWQGGTAGPDSSLRQAILLARLQRPGEELAALRLGSSHAKPGDLPFWHAYGDLAWDRGEKADALGAYRAAIDGGSVNAGAAERLMRLYQDGKQGTQAIEIARLLHARTREPRWLLLAMDAASQASSWQDLKTLLQEAGRDEARYAQTEMYWLLAAQFADHDDDKAGARHAYERALVLNPASDAVRMQILWLEINDNNLEKLATRLQAWEKAAPDSPAYWAPYAIGLVRLGRHDDAIPWFERQMEARPKDPRWLAAYGSALQHTAKNTGTGAVRSKLLLTIRQALPEAPNWSGPDEQALLLTYAALLQADNDAEGGYRVMQQLVDRGYESPEIYARLVQFSLDQDQPDRAREWWRKAQARDIRLPPYQQLAVALRQNDRKGIEQVLSENGEELSVPDRVTALRRLGRNTLALSLTERSLREENDSANELLSRHRLELRRQLAPFASAGVQKRNLSSLRITRSETEGSAAADAGRLTVRAVHNELDASQDGGPLRGKRAEDDLSLTADIPVGDDALRLTLGANLRSDKSLAYSRAEWTHTVGAGTTLRLDASINGLTEETAAMRAIGSKSKVGAALTSRLGESAYARVELAAQRYQTRSNAALGHGYKTEGEVGMAVPANAFTWRLRASGSIERNRVADKMPADPSTSMLVAPAAVADVLARRFSAAGVGATLQYQPGAAAGTEPYAVLDAWTGRQWPGNDPAYSLRAVVNLPVSAAGQLRLETFYTNVQGGVSTQPNRGFGLWYRHEF